jgi:hypothetical protein
MTDCNPAKTPHLEGHDMSARKDDETRQTAENIKKFQHAVGAARFPIDTVGYQIAWATFALAKHMVDPSVRHWMALKKILRFLVGKRDMNIPYYRASDTRDANRHLQAWVDSDWAQCPDTRRLRAS